MDSYLIKFNYLGAGIVHGPPMSVSFDDAYDLPAGSKFSYGTAGFRCR